MWHKVKTRGEMGGGLKMRQRKEGVRKEDEEQVREG